MSSGDPTSFIDVIGANHQSTLKSFSSLPTLVLLTVREAPLLGLLISWKLMCKLSYHMSGRLPFNKMYLNFLDCCLPVATLTTNLCKICFVHFSHDCGKEIFNTFMFLSVEFTF